jgi:hypothetical protein
VSGRVSDQESGVYYIIHKRRQHHQYGKRKADTKQADERKELSALKYGYGYFKIVFKHSCNCLG